VPRPCGRDPACAACTQFVVLVVGNMSISSFIDAGVVGVETGEDEYDVWLLAGPVASRAGASMSN